MATKWIKKINEEKLINSAFGDDGQILWAKKNVDEKNNNNASIELLYLGNLSLYTPDTDEEMGLEREIEEFQYSINRAKRRDTMDLFIKKSGVLWGEIVDGNDESSLLGKALSKNLDLVWVKIDSDFGHIADTTAKDIKKGNIPQNFIKLMTNFFYQPYYCEAMIDYFESKKDKLEKKSEKMTFQQIREEEISEEIRFCADKIAGYYDELNYYHRIEFDKNNKILDKTLNEIEQKYNLNGKNEAQK